LKYCVIGDEDTVLGFGMVGVAGHAVTTKEQVQAAFDEALSNPDNAIIIVTEAAAAHIDEAISAYTFAHDFPLIVEIPDSNGRNPDRPGLREMVNRAIGINL
jgi:V/A-type H+-transporting ATPase subunit F